MNVGLVIAFRTPGRPRIVTKLEAKTLINAILIAKETRIQKERGWAIRVDFSLLLVCDFSERVAAGVFRVNYRRNKQITSSLRTGVPSWVAIMSLMST
jgi:hypothetical protein